MARIRTIKPEFWDSPGTARASLRARLFFIAMWNWADDWGVGDAHPLRLLSFAFPNDESSEVEPRNFRSLAEEVAECFDVEWYEVDGRAFYAIPSWELHQRTEKKAKRKNPAPDQADSRLYGDSAAETRNFRNSVSVGSRKGEGGTGEGGKKLSSVPEVSYDAHAREFSQSELTTVREILSGHTGRPMGELEISVAVELIVEASTEPVQNLVSYVYAAVESSPERIAGLCREASRQVERMRQE